MNHDTNLSPIASRWSFALPAMRHGSELFSCLLPLAVAAVAFFAPMYIGEWSSAALRWLTDAPTLPESIAAGSLPTHDRIDRASANSRDRTGCTPLMWAAERGEVETVRRLLEAGADPRAVSTFGFTALGQAAASDAAEVIALLLDAGVPVDQPTIGGRTPLQLAVEAQAHHAAEALIAYGADRDKPDVNGRTPPHKAEAIASHHRPQMRDADDVNQQRDRGAQERCDNAMGRDLGLGEADE